jgi:hypothetical protein
MSVNARDLRVKARDPGLDVPKSQLLRVRNGMHALLVPTLGVGTRTSRRIVHSFPDSP